MLAVSGTREDGAWAPTSLHTAGVIPLHSTPSLLSQQSSHRAAMAALLGLRALPATSARTVAFRPAARPARLVSVFASWLDHRCRKLALSSAAALQAPLVARKPLPVVCVAATDAAPAPAAEPVIGEAKSGVAILRFQRGSANKVRGTARGPICQSSQGGARQGVRRVVATPPQIRRVLDVIRGRSYEEALVLCEYMPYRACEKIIKCLMSVRLGAMAFWRASESSASFCSSVPTPEDACRSQAAANAKHNKGALKTKLYVSECFADGGPQLKRARPRAQGR